MKTIQYQVNAELSVADVIRVFNASGIVRPTQDAARIEKMFAQANLVVSAWHEGALVGVARGLTDHSYCCYLSDLAVDQAYQRQRRWILPEGGVRACRQRIPHQASAVISPVI